MGKKNKIELFNGDIYNRRFSRALALEVRDALEELHCKRYDLTDERMKELMKDIHNRIYTLVTIQDSRDSSSLVNTINRFRFAMLCTSEWDEAEFIKQKQWTIS